MKSSRTRLARYRRHARVRSRLKGTDERPRLCVFRSANHIYAQVIDDTRGHTLASASTIDPETKAELNGQAKSGKAGVVGNMIAKRALSLGIKEVAFDRGGYKYHGRVKALAESARQGGLKF